MRRIAVLLIVVLSAPFGLSLACELWCKTPAAQVHHRAAGCHSAPHADVAGEQVIPADAGCHQAPAVTAFLNEPRTPAIRPVPMVSALDDTAAVLLNGERTDEGWYVFNGQFARPPAFRTILRI